MPYRVAAGLLFVGLVVLVGLPLSPGAAAGPGPSLPAPGLEWQFPSGFQHLQDLRWSGDDSLLVNDAVQGLLEVRLPGGDGEPVAQVVRAPSDARRPWVHLGLSADHLAGAGHAFQAWWETRGAGGPAGTLSIEYVADLDLHEDRLLLVGLRRGEDGTLGADGSMAWLLRLPASDAAPRPVLPFPPGAEQSLQDCALAMLPKGRFASDGSFLVLAGSEPGLFLYDRSGRLLRTWDTASMDLEQGCELSAEQKRRFGGDVQLRQGWLNQRTVVDEILPLPSGPALLVRSREDGTTGWELLQWTEGANGKEATWRHHDVPVTSPSGWATARGDVRGGRLALLLTTSAPRGEEVPPSRLLIFDLDR